MARQRKYPDELLDRGARMVFDSGRPIAQVANDLGIHHEALRMALGLRSPGAEVALVHHSDRGSQYTSAEFTQALDDADVLGSLGSTGDCFDNALAESFVDSFKTELIAERTWRSVAQAELGVDISTGPTIDA